MALRWAISGTGDIVAKAVAPAMLADPGSTLVAVYSRDAARAAECAARFGAPRAYTDFAALLADDEVDAVYVGGEVGRHAPETIAAARAGKHVLCEKPMALDADEGRAMLGACAASGVHLAIAYYRRYYPSVQRLQELVAGGVIGQPLQAAIDMAYWSHPAPDHPHRWRVETGGGGALMDIGSHRLDVACWLLGEPRRVAGFTAHRVHGYAAPDVETLLAEFADGCHLTLRCNWCGGANQDLLTLVGTEGILLVGALEDTTFTLRRRGRPDEVCTVAPPAQNRHLPLIADFAQRLGRGEAPRHDGWAGFQATRLMAGCYRSAAGGLVVEV